MFSSIKEYERWIKYQEELEEEEKWETRKQQAKLLKEALERNKDKEPRIGVSGWYGPVEGAISMDPTVGTESLIGHGALKKGPFFATYKG